MATTRAQVDLHEKLTPQLQTIRAEIALLSKSKPDGPINSFKLRYINQLLASANTLLTGLHAPLQGFTEFDDADLPSNSDVVFVLSQYLEALEGWRSANVKSIGYNWYWDTGKEKSPLIKSKQPSRFNRTGDE